jgi:hypothetical protein
MQNPWTGQENRNRQTESHCRFPRAFFLVPLLIAGLFLTCFHFVQAQSVHRNGFEGREPLWVKGTADVSFQETAHEVTDLTAHTGGHSEHIQFTAEQGNYIYYFYPTQRAPINEELNASVFVKANRPGVRLMARLVLPKERGAANLDEPLTTLLRSDQYTLVGRWQRLELRNPVKLTKEQQQFLRTELKRDINVADSYIDRLVLNVYGGPGMTEVWIDDLEIGPVVGTSPFLTTHRPVDAPKKESAGGPASRASVVELKQDHLLIGGKGFFFRGIRHTDTPLKTLRDAGLNTVWFDYRTSAAVLEEAVERGFWIVPSLSVTAEDPRLASPDGIRSEVTRFSMGDAVLFWDMGGGLVDEQKDPVLKAIQVIRGTDSQRLVGAEIWDGFMPFTRSLDLIGIHRWPLMTELELPQYREWLEQRRNLGRPGSFTWTWVQTHLPDWFTKLVYDRLGSAGFDEPVGPQPEQIRLLTYIALAAGCRGIGYWSDRFLANSHQGRDRLLEMALLNQELQMLEPLLVTAEPPRWIDTSNPEVKAAVMRTEYGILVLPMWLGKGAQYVPGQSAAAKLTLTVPEVPSGTEPWQIAPVEVRSLQFTRALGGTQITIPEFGLTTAILFTSYNNPTGIIVRFQKQVRAMREQAAQWERDLAEVELDKVAKVETLLAQAGHPLEDGQKLLEDARKRLRVSLEHWNNHDYRQAYQEADRALRPLRILMRAQWEKAIKGLDAPVASPFAVSFYTLPRHWRFIDSIRSKPEGLNLLRGGNFEDSIDRPADAWTLQESKLDAVVFTARRVTEDPKEGRQCLMLDIKPQYPQFPVKALERTFLALNSPSVVLQPGTLVRISGWIRIPKPIATSVDGALFYDSAGGEPLAIRLTAATGWKKFTLYRTVPASGAINVTLALTGLGTVYFDDIRIETLSPTSSVQVPGR